MTAKRGRIIRWPISIKHGRLDHFDLAGSITYVSVVAGAAILADADPRGWLVAGLVTISAHSGLISDLPHNGWGVQSFLGMPCNLCVL